MEAENYEASHVCGSWLTFNLWGWSLNSEFAPVGFSVPAALRVERNDSVTEPVRWQFSGRPPATAGCEAGLLRPWPPATGLASLLQRELLGA